MSKHSQRESPFRVVGAAIWRLDDGRYRPVKVLLNRSTGRFFFLRQPKALRPEGAERGFAYSELSDLIHSGRVTLDRNVAKGLVESRRDFGSTFMSAWPTAEDVLEEIAAWQHTSDQTPSPQDAVSSSPSADVSPVSAPAGSSQETSSERKESGGRLLGQLLVAVPIALAVLWGPVSDWYQGQLTSSQLGGYGLARLDAACASTPWAVDDEEALAALARLWRNDFAYSTYVNDEVAYAWWQVHRNVVRAFRTEDFGRPENVDLEWHGTDFTEAAIEIERAWFGAGGVVGPDRDFMRSWRDACTRVTDSL